ncbi:MAG: MarR family transcriptional regulator [Candidatus Nanopelagicales bacterium]
MAASRRAPQAKTRWLSEDEQRSWRAWVSMHLLLDDRLQRELASAHGLSLADYEILVRLSEAPDRRLRMSELADRALSSRSRLSHQITRLEQAGLVARVECASDRRGFFAVLTDHGWSVLVGAAPTHVTGVREHFVDQLSPEEFAALGQACVKVLAHLQSLPATPRPQADNAVSA